MIVKEQDFIAVDGTPLFKIYSDKHFFLQSKGVFYEETIVREEDIANFMETNIAIPEPIATETFVYQTLIGDYQNITQKQIKEAKVILNKALKTLQDEEAYKVKFLFDEWEYEKNYKKGDRVLYNKVLYNVIQTPPMKLNPEIHTTYYQKVHCPPELIEEWDNTNKKIYNTGDRTRIGEYIYESLIDNNIWAPKDFPDVWKLVE